MEAAGWAVEEPGRRAAIKTPATSRRWLVGPATGWVVICYALSTSTCSCCVAVVSPSPGLEPQQDLRQDRSLANRRIEGEHPYLYLDGIVMKRTRAGEVRNVSLLVASASVPSSAVSTLDQCLVDQVLQTCVATPA